MMTGPEAGRGSRAAEPAAPVRGAATSVAGARARILWAPVVLLLVFACSDGSGAGAAGGREAREGSAPPHAAGNPLLVMAAASLDAAMPRLIEAFGSRSGVGIDLVLASTGSLAAQIRHGAPGDLFFSADEVTVQRLSRDGLIRPGSVRTYAEGQIVLVWREGIAPPHSPQSLAEDRFEVVAIANPEHAPYGMAARDALRELGIWNRSEGKIVLGENVAQTYQLVRTGNADAGMVARSVIGATGAEFVAVDPELHAPVLHVAGALKRSTHPSAEPFLAFVLSERGQSILADHGFDPVAGAGSATGSSRP